ncbi:MAG: hypothetical protein ACRDBO_19100 [Lachnospiraceae bacterium]
MLFGELLDDEREDGYNDGHKNGQDEMNKNWSSLLTIITPEDLGKLQKNPSIITDMFIKYHI